MFAPSANQEATESGNAVRTALVGLLVVTSVALVFALRHRQGSSAVPLLPKALDRGVPSGGAASSLAFHTLVPDTNSTGVAEGTSPGQHVPDVHFEPRVEQAEFAPFTS